LKTDLYLTNEECEKERTLTTNAYLACLIIILIELIL